MSPTNAHPPLLLRLTAPHEPGFILRKIRVQSMRDIWSICEVCKRSFSMSASVSTSGQIVKEQSWYNNLIDSCRWSPEDTEIHEEIATGDVNEEEVDALLSGMLSNLEATGQSNRVTRAGTLSPIRIPVNMTFEAPIPPPLFEHQLHRTHPSLAMIFPSRTPGAPLINASIALDSSAVTCVRVVVNGVAVPGFLEESVRRGGGMGLAGRLWVKSGDAAVMSSQYAPDSSV